MKNTFLGLGSNVGNREDNLLKSILFLKRKFSITNHSSLYFSSPVGYSDQPDFLNMVIEIDSKGIDPFELLEYLKRTEGEIGRKETFHWGPRLIDIDILYIEGVQIASRYLTIPHKELLKRNFVLIPLFELTETLIINRKKILLTELINTNEESGHSVNLYKHKSEIKLDGATP